MGGRKCRQSQGVTPPVTGQVLRLPRGFSGVASPVELVWSGQGVTGDHWASPVSYTHLDVYKRQLWGGESSGTGVEWPGGHWGPLG